MRGGQPGRHADRHRGGEARKSRAPGEATVWDARTGQVLFELKGLQEGVTSLAFSPDGERIITGGGDSMQQQGNEAKVWDAQDGDAFARSDTATAPQVVWLIGAR